MEEIKVGEYIRNNEGYIGKIIKIEKNTKRDCDTYYVCDSCMASGFYEQIKKCSKNIIELLEDNDIVTLEYYVAKYRIRITRIFEISKVLKLNCIKFNNVHCDFLYNVEENKWINGRGYNVKIKKILTKEQFEQNLYKV